MSQSLGTRIEVLGTLTCLGPVHVGGCDTTADADLAVARDGTGAPCLPGTSLAGALRAYLGGVDRLRPHLDALFGYAHANGSGSPSWVRVDDAHLCAVDAAATAPVTVRDGVGIDRRSASAARRFLFTRQVLPAGTRFALRIVADTPTRAPAPDYDGGWPALVRDAVDAMVTGLRHARVAIGAGRGGGHGLVALDEVEHRSTDLSDPAGLTAWLTGTVAPAPAASPAPDGHEPNPPADGHLAIEITWRPVNPLLVRDSLPGTVVDALPLTDLGADGTVRLLLPGSSIRGVVRAHAERIVRTLRREDAPEDFGDGLRRPPPGVDVLFGVAPASRRTRKPADTDKSDTDGDAVDGVGDRRGRRGVLSVADCHSVGSVTAQDWNPVLTSRPNAVPATGEERDDRAQRNLERDNTRTALREHLRAKVDPSFALQVSDHVAIDRWTGGAGDHRLFSVLDPDTTVAWEPIRITIDVTALRRQCTGAANPAGLALPLLLLVLRDLRDGWLSLGYGGTRGRGHIEVTEVTFTGSDLPAPWGCLAGHTLDAVLADPPAEVTDAMAAWAATFDEEEKA